MKWNELAVEFEELAKDGDANVEWVFYARKGIAAQWLISARACAMRRARKR